MAVVPECEDVSPVGRSIGSTLADVAAALSDPTDGQRPLSSTGHASDIFWNG
jgi:hypothetical protein